jgi:hypothetical protein
MAAGPSIDVSGWLEEQLANTRNGYRRRECDTRAGTVDLAIPKLRQGRWLSSDRPVGPVTPPRMTLTPAVSQIARARRCPSGLRAGLSRGRRRRS